MRLAVFHNLPPGGARRAAYELLRFSRACNGFDLYRLGNGDVVEGDGLDPAHLAKEVFTFSLGPRPSILGAEVRKAVDVVAARRAQRRIASAIDRGSYDLVLLHHDRYTQAPTLLPFLRTPSVYYVQEPRRQSFEYALMPANRSGRGTVSRAVFRVAEAWMRRADIRAARAADVLIVSSSYSLESTYRAYGRYPVVCRLGVDGEAFRLGTSGAPRVGLIAVGALDRVKSHDLVIRGAAALDPRRRPSVTVVFERSEESYRLELIELATQLGVQLHLHHNIDDTRLASLYRSSVATVCAASLEPFGLTAIESMACGTPVIGVREGGYRESIVPGVNGLLVDRDVDSIASAIDAIQREPYRWVPEHVRASVVPEFTWDAAARRLDEILLATAQSEGGKRVV